MLHYSIFHQISNRNIIFLFILTVLLTQNYTVNGEIVWEETFDVDFSNWRVSHGAVEIQNGELVVTDCVPAGYYQTAPTQRQLVCLASMWYNSIAMTGTWSFDYFSDIINSNLYVAPVSEGIANETDYCQSDGLDICRGWPNSGYGLEIRGFKYRATDTSMLFGYFIDGTCSCGYSNMPGLIYDIPDGWKHIDITRESNGIMTLYLDYQLVATFSQISPITSYSEYFQIQMTLDDRLDNVTYYDTIDPPEVPTGDVSSSNPGFIEPGSKTSSTYFFGAGMVGLTGILGISLKKKRY